MWPVPGLVLCVPAGVAQQTHVVWKRSHGGRSLQPQQLGALFHPYPLVAGTMADIMPKKKSAVVLQRLTSVQYCDPFSAIEPLARVVSVFAKEGLITCLSAGDLVAVVSHPIIPF